jgi:glycosyltransferase involved in cell wall biosynthesis
VPRYHRLADVLVTTRSRGTNTPLKIYQYLRAGRPIVATDIRSHTQVLDDASAELVAAGLQTPSLPASSACCEDPRMPGIGPRRGRAGRERYSEASYMRKLENLLAQVARRGTAPLAA